MLVLGATGLAAAVEVQNAPLEGSSVGLAEVVVTARKRTESEQSVPMSLTVLSGKVLEEFDLRDFLDYAPMIPNLSFSYGSGQLGFAESRTVAIRGISGQGTTGFYIDESPVFDFVDPRIVDIDRVEVLKGPQGTLFGSSSLGGNVRIITHKPSLTDYEYKYETEGSDTHYANADFGVAGIANFPILAERSAIRIVGYYSYDSGFLTRTFPNPNDPETRGTADNQGAEEAVGASLAGLLRVTDALDLTARVMYQRVSYHGWPAAYAPLPCFCVTSLTLNRAADVQEQSSNRWTLASFELAYRAPGWQVTSATSFLDTESIDLEDGTEGTAYALRTFYGFTLPSGVPSVWTGDRPQQGLAQETRFSFDEVHHVQGTAGVYYMDLRSHLLVGPAIVPGLAATGLWPTDLSYSNDEHQSQREAALFGELYFGLPYRFTATLGGRAYWLRETSDSSADGLFQGGLSVNPPSATTQRGVSPKYGLDYHIDDHAFLYASVAKGFRPGGTSPAVGAACDPELAALGKTLQSAQQYNSDAVWNYELGAKADFPERQLSMAAALFQVDWKNIQQNVYLPICGYPFISNSGAARSRGAELELNEHPRGVPVQLRLALGMIDATITQKGDTPQPVGSRIYQVPRLTASLGMVFKHPVTVRSTAFAAADYSYTGNSVSANNSPTAPLVRPGFGLTNLRFGLRWEKSEISIFGRNLTDVKANYGDLTFLSFEQSVTTPSGAVEPLPRVAVSRPRQIGLQYRYRY